VIIATIIGLATGIFLGFALNISYPSEYSFYITMALLAALDSIIGAGRAQLEGKFNMTIFTTGFFLNALLAGVLAFLGDKLGVPLYYAAILVFGGRLFQNLGVIRRILLDKYILRK
jgi:small basic protein